MGCVARARDEKCKRPCSGVAHFDKGDDFDRFVSGKKH